MSEATITLPLAVGQQMDHPCAGTWEVLEHLGGPHDDYRIRCVADNRQRGSEQDRVTVVHAEYVTRTFDARPASPNTNQTKVTPEAGQGPAR